MNHDLLCGRDAKVNEDACFWSKHHWFWQSRIPPALGAVIMFVIIFWDKL